MLGSARRDGGRKCSLASSSNVEAPGIPDESFHRLEDVELSFRLARDGLELFNGCAPEAN
jgi:GT2 family glycosyltransferase